MEPSPDLDDSLLALLVAEDRGSPCAEQALIEFATTSRAAPFDLADAEYTLALRYLTGDGLECDLELARRHFENAAVFGYPFPDALRSEEC